MKFLTCLFLVVIANPAMAITTGPWDETGTGCEEAISNKIERDAADFKDLYATSPFGPELEAAHYQIGTALGIRGTKLILVATQTSFQKHLRLDDAILIRATDANLTLVGQVNDQAFPVATSSSRTDSEIIVQSPRFSHLFMGELLGENVSRRQDALKKVVRAENLKVDPKLAGHAQQPVAMYLDADSIPLPGGYDFVSVNEQGNLSLHDQVITRLEKLIAEWDKEGLNFVFILKVPVRFEIPSGVRNYNLIAPDVVDRGANNQYVSGEDTRWRFPKTVGVTLRNGYGMKVIVVPTPLSAIP